MDRCIVNITVPGFTCYEVLDIDEVVELEDSYNIIAGNTEMFLDKDHCVIGQDIIIYRDNDIEVYLEAA